MRPPKSTKPSGDGCDGQPKKSKQTMVLLLNHQNFISSLNISEKIHAYLVKVPHKTNLKHHQKHKNSTQTQTLWIIKLSGGVGGGSDGGGGGGTAGSGGYVYQFMYVWLIWDGKECDFSFEREEIKEEVTYSVVSVFSPFYSVCIKVSKWC